MKGTKILELIGTAMISAGILISVGSWITWELNPGKWDMEMRLAMSAGWIVSILAVLWRKND